MNNQTDIGKNFIKPDTPSTLNKINNRIKKTEKPTSSHEKGVIEEALQKELNKSIHKKALKEEVKQRFLNDLDWRISHRPKIWRFTAIFFTIQNIITFAIVILSFFIKPSFDLTTVLSIIIPVSLGTTAYTLKEVTKYLFKEVNYSEYLIKDLQNNDPNIKQDYENLKGPNPQ